MTSRELVYKTLAFRNTADRVPRQLWTLPWAELYCKDELAAIQREYPDDIVTAPAVFAVPPISQGSPYQPGAYIDEWGCRFENIQTGLIGEVKAPLLAPRDDAWEDPSAVHFPEEWLTFDRERVNAFCRGTDRFVLAGCLARPFEQLQFIRGTERLYIDLAEKPASFLRFCERMHDFYCRLLTAWAQTEVDALFIMDDWGAQRSLLISPTAWSEIFLPMYRDYIQIAHAHGKKAFMHSDGYTLDILQPLIDSGLDAINTQIFCIGLEKLKPYRGKLTFWGEIDRQHLLPEGSVDDIRRAVREVYNTLWQDGGCIAQLEFGAAAKAENVRAAFEIWNQI